MHAGTPLPQVQKREGGADGASHDVGTARRWAKEGDEEPYDKVETFFGFLFTQMT